MKSARAGRSRWNAVLLALTLLPVLLTFLPASGAAQEVRGRIVDSENAAPVGLAAVIVLDATREPIITGATDLDGFYSIELPTAGEYIVIVERLGYFENESPLVAVGDDAVLSADFEMRPEPFRLDPLDVVVQNEALEDFLTLEYGIHPATIPGFRSYQGVRLAEAKLKADDNTDLLRWLYIPISHGRQVCVGTYGAGTELPARMGYERVMAAQDVSNSVDPRRQCGQLILDGIRCRNEHIEEIPMDQIAVVVTIPGEVRLYTRDFDWTFKPGSAAGSC